MWALLYLRGTPMTAAQIQATLEFSKGGTSMLLKDLEFWKVVKRTRPWGESASHYEPNTNLREMIGNVLSQREHTLVSRVADDLHASLDAAKRVGAAGPTSGATSAHGPARQKRGAGGEGPYRLGEVRHDQTGHRARTHHAASAQTKERAVAATGLGNMQEQTVFVAGATGFVGTALRETLREQGHNVIAASRNPAAHRKHHRAFHWVGFDLDEARGLQSTLQDATTAYYLVHSLHRGGDLVAREAQYARNFAAAAKQAGVQRIVYLGGYSTRPSTPHMVARQITGAIFRNSGVPATELRASVILGEQSESWKILRGVSAMPWVPAPAWTNHAIRPVDIEDVVAALVDAGTRGTAPTGVFELTGPEEISIRDAIKQVAHLSGRPVRTLPALDLPSALPALALRALFGTDFRVAKALLESLAKDVPEPGTPYWEHMPTHKLESFGASVQRLEAAR